MKKLLAILALSAALGGCLTPSAYQQSKDLAGRPLAEAVELYGPPDQPVTPGRTAYNWSRGRFTGACQLSVRVDPAGRITHASVVALGFQTCRSLLEDTRGR